MMIGSIDTPRNIMLWGIRMNDNLRPAIEGKKKISFKTKKGKRIEFEAEPKPIDVL